MHGVCKDSRLGVHTKGPWFDLRKSNQGPNWGLLTCWRSSVLAQLATTGRTEATVRTLTVADAGASEGGPNCMLRIGGFSTPKDYPPDLPSRPPLCEDSAK